MLVLLVGFFESLSFTLDFLPSLFKLLLQLIERLLLHRAHHLVLLLRVLHLLLHLRELVVILVGQALQLLLMLCLQVLHLALVLLLLVLKGLATRLSQLGMVALSCRQFSLQVRHCYSHFTHLFLYLSIVLTTF